MERIFYLANTADPVTDLPIYLFDTSFLPTPEEINYEELIPVLLQKVPRHPFCLIVFSLGLNRILWVWGLKFLKRFLSDKQNMKNLQKMVTVHELWLVKLLTQILTNYHLTMKNLNLINRYIDIGLSNIVELFALYNANQVKLINCLLLLQLSNYFDITKLKISLAVYRYDAKIAPLELTMRYKPLINQYTAIDYNKNPLFMHHFTQLLAIVQTHGTEVELLFHRPGNKTLTDVLYNCINRNQILWINDWDIYCIGGVVKRITSELPVTLIPVDMIPLPVADTMTYLLSLYLKLDEFHTQQGQGYNRLLWEMLGLASKLLKAAEITKHTANSLARLLAHCMSHQVVSSHSKDQIAIVVRVLTHMIEWWDEIGIEVATEPLQPVERELEREQKAPPLPPRKQTSQELKINDLYNMSFDHTMNDTFSDDEPDLHEQLMALGDIEEESPPPKPPRRRSSQEQAVAEGPPKPSFLRHSRNLSGTVPNVSAHARTRSVGGLVDTNFNATPRKDALMSPVTTNSQFSRIQLTLNLLLSSVDSAVIQEVLAVIQAKKMLSDVSNIALELPTQKYKVAEPQLRLPAATKPAPPPIPIKKPVIRGRKVGELAKLFEERCEGLELLRTM